MQSPVKENHLSEGKQIMTQCAIAEHSLQHSDGVSFTHCHFLKILGTNAIAMRSLYIDLWFV